MITIRIAKPADAITITEMIKKLLIELGDEQEAMTFITASTVIELMQNGKTSVLLAETEMKNIAGILTITESQAIYAGGSYGTIDEMYIIPEYRAQKVGALLIEQAKEVAKTKNWKRLAVTAPPENNERQLQFYKRSGFELAGPKLKVKIEG